MTPKTIEYSTSSKGRKGRYGSIALFVWVKTTSIKTLGIAPTPLKTLGVAQTHHLLKKVDENFNFKYFIFYYQT